MPENCTETVRHVFVYGTLRRGQANDITRLSPAPRLVGNALVRGTLFDLGNYPGLRLEDEGGPVRGEVYAIGAELEARLDEIEAVYPQQHDEYVKRQIPVVVNGRTLTCLVYEVNPVYLPGRAVMAGGDWLARGDGSLESHNAETNSCMTKR